MTKISYLISLISLLPSLNPLAYAKNKAPDFTIDIQTEINAYAPAGHHFNTDAPALIFCENEKTSAAIKSPQKMIFPLQLNCQKDTVTVSLYLCDDKKTFCENHKTKIPTPAAAKIKNNDANKSSALNSIYSNIYSKTELDDFYFNQPQKAFAKALRENKPLLIDFFGIWCPPCNSLDAEVFRSKEFANIKNKFILLKIDADDESSWELKSKYNITGYPSVLILSSHGEEISRIIGYSSKKLFLDQLQIALENKDPSIQILEQKALAGDKTAAKKLAERFLEQENIEAAYKFFIEIAKDQTSKKSLLAQIKWAEQKKDIQLVEKTIKKFLKSFPESLETIELEKKLSEIFALKKNLSEAQRHLYNSIEKIKHFLADPTIFMSQSEYTKGDLLQMLALSYESLNNQDKAFDAWNSCVLHYQQEIKISKKANDENRGHYLELAYCARKGNNTKLATEIYERFETKYPKEFTFYYNHARMHYDLKQYSEALPLAKKAFSNSYGDNHLNSAILLVKIQIALNKKEEALTLLKAEIDNAKKNTRKLLDQKTGALSDSIKNLRVFRFIQQMENQLEEISSSRSINPKR